VVRSLKIENANATREVSIDLPGWTNGRHIYVFAGIEMVAYRHVGQIWMIKSGRCSMCGRCCALINCDKLDKNGSCSLNLERPFCCGLVAHPKNVEECTENFVPMLPVR